MCNALFRGMTTNEKQRLLKLSYSLRYEAGRAIPRATRMAYEQEIARIENLLFSNAHGLKGGK
jgi:hypothetical protein